MGANWSYDLTKLAKGRYLCQRFVRIFFGAGLNLGGGGGYPGATCLWNGLGYS